MKKNVDGNFAEVLAGMRTQSELVILDFNQINSGLPDYKNIKLFFQADTGPGFDPRLPENRQKFNDNFLQLGQKKYLIGRYLEDRIEMLRGSRIAKEGRTIHLGVDLFTSGLETVYAPYEGIVVDVGREPGKHTYGYYAILKHQFDFGPIYSFYGHLSSAQPVLGTKLVAGQPFAKLGDYVDDENGGWSRHLHFQLLTELPPAGEAPIGYSTPNDLEMNKKRFPDPNQILQLPNI